MNDVKLNVSQSRGYEGAEVKTISSREVAEMMEGGRVMNDVKLNVSQSRGYEGAEVKTISSREVAEMMEVKKHSDMLAKIDKLNQSLENGNFRSQDYWLESVYKTPGNNKTYREYQVTKKGCELIAHKTEGDKGVVFTVRYMERFEQMERIIQERNQKANLLLMIYEGCELIAHKTEGDKGVVFTVRYMERFEQMERIIQERNQKANLLLMIYEGGQDGVFASKQLVEIETRELNQQIQVMAPKAESYDQFIDADGTYTTTNACKMLGLNRAEVFRVLREKGMVYKKKTEATTYTTTNACKMLGLNRTEVFKVLREKGMVYKKKTEATQKAVDKGYFRHVIKGGHSTMVITAKGVEYLRELFLDEAC